MIHCRGCGQTIHETATACPHCGATQTPPAPAAAGSLWLPVPAFVCALLAVLGLAGADHPDRELALGGGLFATVAIVLAGLSLARQPRGRGLAIAAMVLGVIGLLAAIGTQM